MNLIYQVAVGKPSNLYEWCISSVADYCKEHGYAHIIQREPILRIAPDPARSGRSKEATSKHGGFLPIFEKENAFGYFSEYDKIAIIDSDVYVRPGSPDIFADLGEADFGGVLEKSLPITRMYANKILKYSRGQYGPLKDVDWRVDARGHDFYNMGIMVMGEAFKAYLNGETPAEFLRRPEFARFIDGVGMWKWSTDQTLLNWWVRKSGMKRVDLSWKWNCLFRAVPDKFLKDAHFVHFFLKDLLPARGENVSTLDRIINHGEYHLITKFHR